MIILGIETSCDETAVAVLEVTKTKLTVKSSAVSSQIKKHKQYGGVVPEVAARNHMQNMMPILQHALDQAGVGKEAIELVAATYGPGLATSLMVGLETGKSLAFALNIPFVAVNHMAGHVFSWLLPKQIGETVLLPELEYPFLALLVSGGHTQLVKVHSAVQYELLGNTVDDAVGEAFDKVARMMKLPYPGGPEVSRLALNGDATAFELPRPMLHSKDLNFSFAGLKTAVLYALRKQAVTEKIIADMCASFQTAAVEVLIKKTLQAVSQHNISLVTVAGGVSANQFLREQLQGQLKQQKQEPHCTFPELQYTGDNGAMIALAGYIQYQNAGPTKKYQTLSVKPNLSLA